MSKDDPRVSEAEAARIWERAAELQSRAMHQAESRARELRAGREGEDGDLPDSNPVLAEGFALEEVRNAAREAGISPDFVDRALAELRHEEHHLAEPPGLADRMADTLLEGPVGSLVGRRTIEGEGQALLGALNHVLTGPGYGLRLVDLEGEDPLDGAAMVFKVPGFTGMSGVDFAYRAAWLSVDTLMVTVRSDAAGAAGHPAGEGEGPRKPGWEVELLMPLRKGRRVNAWGSVFTSGTTGLMGGLLGTAAGFGVATGLALPGLLAVGAMAALGLGGVGGGGWGGAALYRKGWRHGATEMTRTLEETLRQVALHTRTGGSFQLRPPGSPPGGQEDSGVPSWLLPGIS